MSRDKKNWVSIWKGISKPRFVICNVNNVNQLAIFRTPRIRSTDANLKLFFILSTLHLTKFFFIYDDSSEYELALFLAICAVIYSH